MLALQRAQLLLVEDLVDEALVAHGHDVAVLGGRDPGRLLAAVLERVEREVRRAARPRAPGRVRRRRRTRRAVRRERRGRRSRARPKSHGSNGTGGPPRVRPQRAGSRAGRAQRRATVRRPVAGDAGTLARVPPEERYVRQRPRPDRPPAHPRAHRARGEAPQRGDPEVRRDVPARARGALRRRRVLLPAARPVADLPRARRRPDGLGRRRQRVPRLPQRLRLDGPGPRAPRDRPRAAGALRARHALRRPDRGRDRRRRGAAAPLGPRPLALHELRLGVDDGRDPDRARVHGPRHRDEDLRLLPRPPRHGDGLDRRRVRQDRRPREPRLAALRRGHPAGRRRT